MLNYTSLEYVSLEPIISSETSELLVNNCEKIPVHFLGKHPEKSRKIPKNS